MDVVAFVSGPLAAGKPPASEAALLAGAWRAEEDVHGLFAAAIVRHRRCLDEKPMTDWLEGKVALITGATSAGIGRGTALAMARRGATIAVTGRDPDRIEQVVEDVRAAGGKAQGFTLDVRNLDQVNEVPGRVAGQLGRIDVLMNTAQEHCTGTILDMTEEVMRAGYESSALATFRMMKSAYPYLAQTGDSVIFNFMSGASVRWDMSGYGIYGGLKAMVRAMSRAAAAEWGKDGIRVLVISPLALSTGLKKWIVDRPEESEAFFQTIPMRRIGDPDSDIAEAICGLCQKEFAYLTGASIPLDGGQANLN